MGDTRFRVWFQPSVNPTKLDPAVWADDVTVAGTGSDLRRLVLERQDVFAALMELRPEDE